MPLGFIRRLAYWQTQSVWCRTLYGLCDSAYTALWISGLRVLTNQASGQKRFWKKKPSGTAGCKVELPHTHRGLPVQTECLPEPVLTSSGSDHPSSSFLESRKNVDIARQGWGGIGNSPVYAIVTCVQLDPATRLSKNKASVQQYDSFSTQEAPA